MASPWAGIAIVALAAWIGMGLGSVAVLWWFWFRDRAYRRRWNMPRNFVALTFAVVGTISFLAASWAAFLTVRTLLGFERLPWSPIVTVPLLIAALSISIYLAGVLLYQRLRY